MHRFPSVDQARQSWQRRIFEDAQSGLAEAVRRREPWAVQFALKQLRRGEGYGEQEPVRPASPITVTFNLKKASAPRPPAPDAAIDGDYERLPASDDSLQ